MSTPIEKNTIDLQAVLAAVNALPEAGGGSAPTDPVLQSKTVTPKTTKQTVTPDSGYDGLSDVVVNAMPVASLARPNISVNTSGLITAKVTQQSSGYVPATVETATLQLTVQGAQTITPSTADKTIAARRYLTGVQTIKGDANLIPENIKKGVSIFGVEGTVEVSAPEDLEAVLAEQESLISTLQETLRGKAAGEGGGTDTRFADLVTDNLTSVNDDSITIVRANAFYGATALKTVTLPNVTKIGTNSFRECDSLESVDLPKVDADIPTYAFQNSTALKHVNIPLVTRLQNRAFSGCSGLEKLDLGQITTVGNYVFTDCASLTALIIRNANKAATLSAANSFTGTPIASGTGHIYVNSALLDNYKAANGWSTYAAQFRAIEDYPEITGGEA